MPKKHHRSTPHKFVTSFIFVLIGVFIATLILNQFVDLNPKWAAPEVKKSQDGTLEITLNAKESQVLIGSKNTKSQVYNGKYIGDTWVVQGGDTVKVHFENDMTDPTNLHFHGGHVSPKGNSDNVLLKINPGETFDYEYRLPKNHPPGLYWYHPHLHHYTDPQVMGGMLGAIIVKGDIDSLPGIKGVPERLLVLTTRDQGNNVIRLVNNKLET